VACLPVRVGAYVCGLGRVNLKGHVHVQTYIIHILEKPCTNLCVIERKTDADVVSDVIATRSRRRMRQKFLSSGLNTCKRQAGGQGELLASYVGRKNRLDKDWTKSKR